MRNNHNVFIQQTVTTNQTIVNGIVQEYSENIVSAFNPSIFQSQSQTQSHPQPQPQPVLSEEGKNEGIIESATHEIDLGDDDAFGASSRSEDEESDSSVALSRIYEIMRSMDVDPKDCHIEFQPNGLMELNFQNRSDGTSPVDPAKAREIHMKVIQGIMEQMYLDQIGQQAHHMSSSSQTLIGEFTVYHQNEPLTIYQYSNEEEEDEEEDDEDGGEIRPDFFIDDKLINKIVGKAEKIKKEDPLITNEEECYICFEKYKERELKRKLPKCGHYFHKKCIDKWLKSKSTCPHCRCDLMEDATIEDEDLMRYFKAYHCKCHQ